MNNTYSLRLALAVLALASVLDTQAQTGGVFSEVLADAVHFQNSGGDTPLGFEAWNNTINFRYQNAYFGSLNAVTGALSINGRLTTGGGVTLGWGVLDLVNADTSGGASDSAGIKAWNTIRLYSTCTGYTSNANYGIQFSPRDGSAVFKGNVGIGVLLPRANLEVVSNSPTATANLMVTSGQDRTPRIRFNGPWSVSNANESYAQIVAVNDNGGPGSSAASLHFFTSSGDPAVLSDKVVIAGSGNIGVGTTTPAFPLHVRSPNADRHLAAFVDAAGHGLRISGWSMGANFDPLIAEDSIYIGRDTSLKNLVIQSGNVGIGTTNPTNKLEVNGTIRTKEVIVETTGWSDYVFAPDYRLAPLSEVEAHIQAKGTLPGIPSAAEVAEHGVSVGDMQAKLLAKVEELTLHVIALSKEVESLKAENAALRTK